ncbi:MAG: serine--tRNA ligase, partial [Monoglobales bacterium]
MIDIKKLRTEAEDIKKIMENRGEAIGDIDKILELDKKRREFVYETEQLKAKQNEVSKQIPALKKEGKDV